MSAPLAESLSTELTERYLRTRGLRYFRGQHDGEFFFVANADPLSAPWMRNASMAYSLQLGQNRQFAPMKGRSVH